MVTTLFLVFLGLLTPVHAVSMVAQPLSSSNYRKLSTTDSLTLLPYWDGTVYCTTEANDLNTTVFSIATKNTVVSLLSLSDASLVTVPPIKWFGQYYIEYQIKPKDSTMVTALTPTMNSLFLLEEGSDLLNNITAFINYNFATAFKLPISAFDCSVGYIAKVTNVDPTKVLSNYVHWTIIIDVLHIERPFTYDPVFLNAVTSGFSTAAGITNRAVVVVTHIGVGTDPDPGCEIELAIYAKTASDVSFLNTTFITTTNLPYDSPAFSDFETTMANTIIQATSTKKDVVVYLIKDMLYEVQPVITSPTPIAIAASATPTSTPLPYWVAQFIVNGIPETTTNIAALKIGIPSIVAATLGISETSIIKVISVSTISATPPSLAINIEVRPTDRTTLSGITSQINVLSNASPEQRKFVVPGSMIAPNAGITADISGNLEYIAVGGTVIKPSASPAPLPYWTGQVAFSNLPESFATNSLFKDAIKAGLMSGYGITDLNIITILGVKPFTSSRRLESSIVGSISHIKKHNRLLPNTYLVAIFEIRPTDRSSLFTLETKINTTKTQTSLAIISNVAAAMNVPSNTFSCDILSVTKTQPAAPPPTTTSADSGNDSGAIIGGVIGGLVFVGIIGGLVYIFIIKPSIVKAAVTESTNADPKFTTVDITNPMNIDHANKNVQTSTLVIRTA